MFVVGTAGHVDHGKSALVQAMTGMDPDRLPEEKRRGMTTDLGFAWLNLPSGREISIVDVPGHAKYIKNMLAGAGAIDLALIVVAADEGPMPQTREHLAILDLVGVRNALFVLTKVDRVSADFVDLVEAELEELVSQTPFSGARTVRTSSRTLEGIAELATVIDSALEAMDSRPPDEEPRLAIDRVFNVKGFGRVVTGTLMSGRLEVGAEIELQPGGYHGRVRGLQRHEQPVPLAEARTRLAVNLIGDAAEEARRGMVLARPGVVQAVKAIDVEVRVPRIVSGSVRHNEVITVLAGTAEAQGRLRLLGAEELSAGQKGWGQVVLESALGMRVGDRLTFRTPNETVAGGTVLALNPRRHRGRDGAAVAELARQADAAADTRVLSLLRSGPRSANELSAEIGVSSGAIAQTVAALSAQQLVVEHSGRAYSQSWLQDAAARVVEATRRFLADNPLRAGAPREHVRGQAKLDAPAFEAALAVALATSQLEEAARRELTLPGHEVVLPPALRQQADAFLAGLLRAPHSPPTDNLPGQELLSYLSGQGLIADTGAGVVFERAIFDAMVETVRAFIAEHGSISLAETRDLFGTTRKYAQAFLEYLDALRITRRTGETRTLLPPR